MPPAYILLIESKDGSLSKIAVPPEHISAHSLGATTLVFDLQFKLRSKKCERVFLCRRLASDCFYVEGAATFIFRAPQRTLLAAVVTALASSAFMRPARRSSKASKSISRNSSPSRASKGLYLGFVSFAMGRLFLSRPSVRRNYMVTTTCQHLLTIHCKY